MILPEIKISHRDIHGVRRSPPDPGLPHYKTIKTSLASVLRLQGKQPVIAEAACTINKIVVRSLLFLRLYLIHHRDNPPVVDADFVDTVFKTVCVVKAVGRPPSTTKVLRRPCRRSTGSTSCRCCLLTTSRCPTRT